MRARALLEAPQATRDKIIDRMIDETAPALLRWILGLDACRLGFRRTEHICECGESQ